MIETTKCIPFEIGELKGMITIELRGPASKMPKRGNNGKRLPDNTKAEIERMLKEGMKPAAIQEATSVSSPTIYLMRTRMIQAGEIAASAKKGLLDMDPIEMPAGANDEDPLL